MGAIAGRVLLYEAPARFRHSRGGMQTCQSCHEDAPSLRTGRRRAHAVCASRRTFPRARMPSLALSTRRSFLLLSLPLTTSLVLVRAPTGGDSTRWSEASAALDALCFPAPGLWKASQYAEELESESSEVLGAWSDDAQLVGLVCCKRVLDESYLLMMIVHPDWHGRRVGEGLLRAALRSAWEAEQSLLTLEVRESNAAALALYAKCGLREVGRRPRYYKEPQEDALLLTVALQADTPPPLPAYASLGACDVAIDGTVLGTLRIASPGT